MEETSIDESVEFIEGNSMVRMCVDAREDDFLSEEGSEIDKEIMFNNTEQSENNNVTVLNQDEIFQEEEQSQEERQNVQGTNRMDLTECREVIGEVVNQAVEKMQIIMDKGGFSEAASLIKEHFGGKRKSTPGKSLRKSTHDENCKEFNSVSFSISHPLQRSQYIRMC